MQLFKFLSLSVFILVTTLAAKPEYKKFTLIGGKIIYVNENLCNPDNYIGTDVVLNEKICSQVPQLKGAKVNVWQMAQFAGIFIYGFGLRGRQVAQILTEVIPTPLQSVAATAFPFDFVDDNNQGENFPNQDGNEHGNASIFFTQVNNSKNPIGAARLYVRSCLAAKKLLAGVEFGYDDAEGYYMRPCGGFLTTTDITSSLGIGLSKIVENVIVDASKDCLGFDAFGQRMVRVSIKTMYLGMSMWAKGQFGWFAYTEPKASEISQQNSMLMPSLDNKSTPLSTIPNSNANLNRQSDVSESAPSGSDIPPAPILSSGRPVNAGNRAALFDDIRNKKKTLNPVEEDQTEKRKSDLPEGLEGTADLIQQKMAERRKSSGYADDDMSHFPHSKSTDANNEDW